MSSSTARPPVPRSRVSSGVPWWIWGMIGFVAAIVIWSLASNAVPVDPDQVFAAAMKSAESGDAKGLETGIAQLKEFPERTAQLNMLEAMLFVGRSRPLKAVPLLEIAAKDDSLKVRALSLLGSCYASASDRRKALVTLEEAVAYDSNANDARLNIVRLLSGNLAWNEALTQGQILIEQEAKLPEAHSLRGDIFFELQKFAEAAKEFEASIEANEHDPSNGVKVAQLLKCLSQTHDYSRVEEFLDACDTPGVRDCVRAEKLLSEGKREEAIVALGAVRRDTPNDPWMCRIHGQALLTTKSPEKAAEGVAALRPVAAVFTRDAQLYEVFGKLAALAGDDELAAQVNQNLEQMRALNDQAQAQLAVVVATRDDPDARIKLATLAADAGRFDLSRKAWEALISFYPEREAEFTESMLKMNVIPPPFVPITKSAEKTP